MLQLVWIMVLLHSQTSLSLATTILKHALQKLDGPLMTIAFFRKWTTWTFASKLVGAYVSQGKALGSHMVGWRYPGHPDTPTMIGGP